MDAEHERALVAWANTFGVGASSLADFASGDLLVPIARAILAQDHFASDNGTSFEANKTGWPILLSLLRSARIMRDSEHEQQAKVDHGAEANEGGILAVSCLEALLGYAVGEECADREAIICDIMSLDAPDQYILRRIIVDRRSSNPDTSFCEAGAETSPVGSPVSSLRSCHASETRFDSEDYMSPTWTRKSDGSHLKKGTLGLEILQGGLEPRRQGCNLAFEAEDVLDATSAQQDAARSKSCNGNDQTAQTLREEINSLQQQRDEANAARDNCAKTLSDHRSESASRETELMEELLRARRMVEKAANSEETSFIAAEKALRMKHEEKVSRLLERASDAERRVSELEILEDEVARLRDEVDILQPYATNLSKAEENLARCRAKIEELGDLPQQLKREEDAHAEVLDRCLGMETEVSKIPALRRQLDGYKRAKTEMEVASREQGRELKLAKEEMLRLTRETEALSDESEAVRHEHRRLQEELKRRAMEEEAGGGGIGEGVSELNPALSEELTRLRREKQQLTAKIDYNTVEMIQELEQRADDADRLADSFHEQLAAERRRSAAAEGSLADARKDIDKLKSEMTELRAEHEAEVAKLGAEAELASRLAAEELDCAKREACETLAASECAAAEALDSERSRGAEALATAERAAAEVAEGLRAEKARAAEQAEAEAIAAAEDHARVVADLEATMAAAETGAAQEKARMEQEAEAQAELARSKERDAAAKLAEVLLASETELERTKETAERELSETKRAAASELASAQDETAQEREARLDERRMKEDALARVQDLERELEDGKRAATEAFRRLKDRARESRESAALEHERVQKELEARLTELQSELHCYRETHTVADETYNADMDRWEHQLTTQRALIANLHGEVDALKKDKRRLEREKAYYWGQAEELRLSQAGGSGRGTTDATLNEDHAQLLEQAQELIEENRHLKQRLQEGDGLGAGDAASRPARWGGSGVAAMRAEHESEVTALKEEKLDMVMKYQASAARVREQEQRCAELTESVEDLQMQVTKLQLVCKRQEKKLASAAAATCKVGSQASSIESSTVTSINELSSAPHPTSGCVEPKMPKTSSMGADKDKENTIQVSNCTLPGGRHPVSDPSDRSRCESVGPGDIRSLRAQGHTEGRTYSVSSPGSSSPARIPKRFSRDEPLAVALGSGKPNAADPPLAGGRDKRQRALRGIENGPCVVDGVGRGVLKGDGGEARRFRKEDEPIGVLKASAVTVSTGEEETSECRQS